MKKVLLFLNSSKVSPSSRCLSAILLLCVTNSIITVLGENFPVPTARIALINLHSGHLIRTVTNKANHEVILTQPTSYRESYLFECNASYPLEWNYFGEGAPTTHADVGRHFVDFYNVNSYTYQAVLYLHSLDELQSGRYICRGSQPEQERLQVHYDLFVPGNGTQMLISNAEKKVFVPESKLMTSLPCEVTDPSVTLQLYKENSWGGFLKLEMNDSIMFRPRKGFIIKMHELPDPFGTYICATPDNKRRRKVHLIPERFRQKYDDGNNYGAKVPVHLSYDYEYSRMVCCNQANPNNGDVGHVNALAPKLQWAACGSVLDCKIKSVCFDEDRCRDNYKWLDPGPLPRGCTGWKLTEGDFGIFKCSTPGVTQYQPFLLNRGNMFVDFEVAPPSESILTMTKLSSDPIYLGSEVEYHCNSTRFYFAFGLRWAFKRGNDDIEFIGESSSYVVKDEYPLMSHHRRTKFRILNPDIKAIICFVPIANSPTEWRTVSLPITIKDPISPKIPAQRPGFPDFHANRNIHSSPSQNYLTVLEPYSTSRPILLQNLHSMEVIDPTPSVDIDEIMSLGGGKHPSNAHSHHSGSFGVGKTDTFSNYAHPHQSNTQSQTRDRFPPVTTYPRGPYTPEFAPSQSMHHELSHSQDRQQEVIRDHHPPHNHHYDHNHQFGLTPPTVASLPPVRIMPITPVPEIITLDNVKNFQNEKYNFPSQAEIEEANMRHRHKFQARHEEFSSYATTPKPVFPPAPIDSSSSRYNKFSHVPQINPQYNHDHDHQYDFKDGKIKYTEKPRYEDFSSSPQHKEFKVSSRLELSPQYTSKSSSEQGHVSSEKSSVNVKNRYSTLYSPQTQATTSTTQKPFRYFNDKGFLLEKDKFENFGAPIPVKLPQYQRQPVIHYDSREKQFGLRDPLIPVVTKQWKLKSSEEIDRFVEESPIQVHNNRHQSRPHQPHSQAATTWDRGYSQSHGISDSNLMKSPLLDVEAPVVVEEMDSVANDYYTASLMSSRRNKASTSSHNSKASGRKSSSSTDSSIRPSSYHRHDKNKNRYSSTAPDYDGDREKYYHQRHPDPKDEVGGHDLHPSHVSASYPSHHEQTYLQDENTVRRHGRYNHYLTGDFVKWDKV